MSGWSDIAAAAAPATARLRQALANPGLAQRVLLQRLLAENAGTVFGAAHGFAGVRTPEEFRQAVPVRSYEQFANWIDRAATGEPAVLTAEPVLAFERTGGSTAGGKLIPYTAGLLAAFRSAVLPWLGSLLDRRPGIARGRAYVAVSPAARVAETTPGGHPVGLPSEGAYLGADLARPFAEILVNGAGTASLTEMSAWQLATLRDLVAADDLRFISVWSPTFLGRLLDGLATHPEPVLARLAEAPAAASRLRAALSGSTFRTDVLWPRLDTISCWTDGPSKPLAYSLAQRLPDVFMEPKGLLATESAITLPFGYEAGSVPALNSAFLEFVDLAGQIFLVDELTTGESYRVLITTPGGLYRYDIGDRLLCSGHAGEVPILRFLGRAGVVSDLVGEKLSEDFVGAALSGLPCAAMLVAKLAPQPHYELWLDGRSPVECEEVEARLRANPQYAYARGLGQLGPLKVVCKPGFNYALQDARIGQGRRLGDLKAQALLPWDAQDLPMDQLADARAPS
jgi:hypothetical protein